MSYFNEISQSRGAFDDTLEEVNEEYDGEDEDSHFYSKDNRMDHGKAK